MQVLQAVLKANPQDAHAHYYLGNLLYDKKHYASAVNHWKLCTQLKPGFAIPWRNLALAAYNLDHDLEQALIYIEKAYSANPNDPRILMEYDQILYRKACPAAERLAKLEDNLKVVNQRDDLVSQRIMLHNCIGQPKRALEIASQRSFHPWEGGEGSVAEHYANAHWILGREALENGDARTALDHFLTGQQIPDYLGEIPWEAELVHLVYFSGLAYDALGEHDQACQVFEKVLSIKGDLSITAYYHGRALIKLGRSSEGEEKLKNLLNQSRQLADNPPGTNYFYYGNPNPVFEDDPKKLQINYYTFLAGMAFLGLGDIMGARSALGQVLAVDPTRLLAYEEYRRL
jgi:tetratricopeptide (TPR) repeat protein